MPTNAVPEAFKIAALNGSILNTELDICVFGAGENGANLHLKNQHIVSESMNVTQAVCDEESLKFGGCISNGFEIEISKNVDLTGRYITVSCTQTVLMPTYPGAHLLPGAQVYPGYSKYTQSFYVFSGDVFSCKFSKNRLTRTLVAYDRFYSRGSPECSDWLSGVFGNSDTITLGQLRSAVVSKMGLTEAEPGTTLPADSFPVYKLEREVTLLELLKMTAEFNGVFLWINGHGDLEYLTFSDVLQNEKYEYYMKAEAEEMNCPGFDCLETDLGVYNLFGTGQNYPYYLENDLVTNGHTTAADVEPGAQGSFQTEFDNVKSSISPNFQNVVYRPAELKAPARLWVRPCDRIIFPIRWYSLDDNGDVQEHNSTINSVVLSRRITGIHAMTDEITANGESRSQDLIDYVREI